MLFSDFALVGACYFSLVNSHHMSISDDDQKLPSLPPVIIQSKRQLC